MAQIVYNLQNLLPQKALILRADSWCRKLPFGNNWSRIRFGFVFTVGDENTRAANITDFGLTFGVGSSFPYMPGSYRCTNMIGASPAGYPTPGIQNLLTYYTTAWAGWSSAGINPQFFNRQYDPQQGPVWSLAASSTSAVGFQPDPSVGAFINHIKSNNILVVEFLRGQGGGGTALCNLFYLTAAQCQAGGYYWTEADLMDAVNTLGTPIIQGLTFTPTGAISMGVSEAAGPLDTLFISYNKKSVPINISAIGCCVHNEMTAPYFGGGADSFAVYGTQNLPPYTTSGSLSSGEWYGTQGATSWTVYGTGWTGTSMSPLNLAGTTIGAPFDTFAQYTVSNTILTTEISAGTGWAAAGIFSGTNQNVLPQVGQVGTSTVTPIDLFTQYVVTGGTFTGSTILTAGTGWAGFGDITGTAAPPMYQYGLAGTSVLAPVDLFVQYVVTGGTFTGNTFLTRGTGWGAAGDATGTGALAAPQFGLQGTTALVPADLFVQYVVTGGTFSDGVFLNAGTGWSAAGTITGTAAPAFPQIGLAGTSLGLPFDLMTQYEPGAVTSGVTISAGTGWIGSGVIV